MNEDRSLEHCLSGTLGNIYPVRTYRYSTHCFLQRDRWHALTSNVKAVDSWQAAFQSSCAAPVMGGLVRSGEIARRISA
jgi:hypothetical protein